MSFVFFVIGSLAVLLLVSGGYTFFVACHRKKDLPWFDKVQLEKTSYGKYYDLIQNSQSWLTSHNAQDVYIESFDGLRLHGLWIPASVPKATIILAHGYRSTMLVDFGMVFDFYHNLGLNILVPEQRCHGKSQGRYITFGVKESKDMYSWITYHNCHLSNTEIILSGLSMGASTMLYLADEDLPQNVKGIIADCGFTSPKAIISKVFSSVTHLPAAPSVWVANAVARIFAGFGLNDKDTRHSLKNSKIPVVLVHGTADDFVPCSMSKEGYAACASKKHLLLVDGAGHGLSFLKNTENF